MSYNEVVRPYYCIHLLLIKLDEGKLQRSTLTRPAKTHYHHSHAMVSILDAMFVSSPGVDLASQEHLEKEFEDLFRCQTCSKAFASIEQLYGHQNELGHLELKQTPRGPGYLCWKKGCNQYFKTASSLQVGLMDRSQIMTSSFWAIFQRVQSSDMNVKFGSK